MIALSPNVVDWIIAILLGIPLLVVAVCWLVVYADERWGDCPCDDCRGKL
jgi:uncharacterized membrane protein HdeD (DUF308 family)